MKVEEILKKVDHTLLAQTATKEEIRLVCTDAAKFHTASVCIPPCFVKEAKEYLCGTGVAVCTVIGFPSGNTTTHAKCAEAREAIQNGADEIDMVANLGFLREGDDAAVLSDIRALRAITEGKILKVIIECCLLQKDEKERMCRIVSASGADFIKTSTGFSSGGATFDDVALMKKHIAPGVKIKAAGGISSLEDAEKFLSLGADRLGTSRIVRIAKQMNLIGR